MICEYCKKDLDANNTSGFCSGDCFVGHNVQVSIRYDMGLRVQALEQAGKFVD